MSLSILPPSLPTKQFTAGSLLKQHPGAKLADVRAALDDLVTSGILSVKVAGSGARNYKLTSQGAAVKRSDEKAGTDAEWEDPPRPGAPTEASTDKVERARLAGQEAKALKAWQADGEKGPRPATPNLDAVNAGKAAKAPRAGKASTEGKRPRGTTVQFLIDGKPMPASQNKLSSVAWYHTKGVGGTDVPRISSKALQSLLAAEGIDDPGNTAGWSVTLDNDKVLSTVAFDG